MSQIGDYLTALETKLKTCTVITNPALVLIGESDDILGLQDDQFPRLEVLISKDKQEGYSSQRKIDYAFRYSIAGYSRRSVDAVSLADMVGIMNFGTEVRKLNYSFLDDKQAGSPPCAGFLMMGEFSETYYEFELFPRTNAFILEIEAKLELSDTEE